jgi:Uma2 family endonuclease
LRFASDDAIVVDGRRSANAMAPAPSLMTVDEYFRTPETLLPSELVYGMLHVAEAPAPRHQSAVADLFRALDAHVRGRLLGRVWLAPLDVVLDERRALVVQPDLLFISNERAGIVRDRVRGAPDLVVEVLSPQPRVGQTQERIRWFAEYGVRECWIVHQHRREITVIEFAADEVRAQPRLSQRDVIRSVVLPDFNLTLEQILVG